MRGHSLKGIVLDKALSIMKMARRVTSEAFLMENTAGKGNSSSL